MKRFIYLSILALLAFSTTSNPVPNSKLIEAFGKEKVEFIIKNNPQLIYYYNFYLDNVWYLSPLPQDKEKAQNIEGQVVLPLTSSGKVDKSKVNVLKLKIKRYYDKPSYYKIKNTSRLLVFLSEEKFNEKYNDYRRKLGLLKN